MGKRANAKEEPLGEQKPNIKSEPDIPDPVLEDAFMLACESGLAFVEPTVKAKEEQPLPDEDEDEVGNLMMMLNLFFRCTKRYMASPKHFCSGFKHCAVPTWGEDGSHVCECVCV